MRLPQFILVPCALATFAAAAVGQTPPPQPKAEASPAQHAQPQSREVTKIEGKVGPGANDTLTVLVDVNDAPDAKAWAIEAAN